MGGPLSACLGDKEGHPPIMSWRLRPSATWFGCTRRPPLCSTPPLQAAPRCVGSWTSSRTLTHAALPSLTAAVLRAGPVACEHTLGG